MDDRLKDEYLAMLSDMVDGFDYSDLDAWFEDQELSPAEFIELLDLPLRVVERTDPEEAEG